jgi:DeoR family transcriptional regulator, fructose operon transcriptional repressor
MYAAERRRQILEMIHTEASVKVTDLARLFGVSSSTIRRDLNELHRAELLERTYGGALTSLPSEPEPPFSERSITYREEKERIGQAAARLVAPGDTIVIDGGTTTECMARHLRELSGLTVVTFGVNIVNALAGANGVTVIGIGGVLLHRTMLFGGVLALDALQFYHLRFDKAFLAATGVSAEGITNFGFEEIPLKRKAIEYAKETILLADASKVGVRAPGFVAPARSIHRLITGTGAPLAQVEALRQVGVAVDQV